LEIVENCNGSFIVGNDWCRLRVSWGLGRRVYWILELRFIVFLLVITGLRSGCILGLSALIREDTGAQS